MVSWVENIDIEWNVWIAIEIWIARAYQSMDQQRENVRLLWIFNMIFCVRRFVEAFGAQIGFEFNLIFFRTTIQIPMKTNQSPIWWFKKAHNYSWYL